MKKLSSKERTGAVVLAVISLFIVGGTWFFRNLRLTGKESIPIEALELWTADSMRHKDLALPSASTAGNAPGNRVDTKRATRKKKHRVANGSRQNKTVPGRERSSERDLLSDTIPVKRK